MDSNRINSETVADHGTEAFRLLLPALLAGAFAFACFFSIADRIDFHPDEAIYLSRVSLNLHNDSGLFFNGWYWLTTLGAPTPVHARISCAMLGALSVACITYCFGLWFPNRKKWQLFAIPLLLTFSYQGLFLVLRVRPELSWICLSSVIATLISAMHVRDHGVLRIAALSSLTLLPMNHRLSWLACVCILGYIVLFGWKTFGKRFTLLAITTFPLGVVLNFLLRPLLLDESFASAWVEFKTMAESAPRMPPIQFLHNVFWECSRVFADNAANPSWWRILFPSPSLSVLNHHAIANWFWAAAVVQPWFGRTWAQRYVLGIPMMWLLMMYVAGYFNPTYFSGFAAFSIFGFLFLLWQSDRPQWQRLLLGTILASTLLNGCSFLATRVLSHGRASYFAIERDLQSFVAALPPDVSIAVSERYQSATRLHPGHKVVVYKNTVPDSIDYMIVDQYDDEMYSGFFADATDKRNQIARARQNFNMVANRLVPVYWHDTPLPITPHPNYELVQGSWFFRNGVHSRLFVLQNQSRQADTLSPLKVLFTR